MPPKDSKAEKGKLVLRLPKQKAATIKMLSESDIDLIDELILSGTTLEEILGAFPESNPLSIIERYRAVQGEYKAVPLPVLGTFLFSIFYFSFLKNF